MLDHGDIKLLKVFLAVVERGSMAGAATALHRSSAAVSEAISKLEAKLGFSVLVRTARGCKPTPAGRDLAHTARSLLEHVDNSLASIGRPSGEPTSLSIGNVYGMYNEMINESTVDGYSPRGVSMTIENPGSDIVAAEVDLAILLGPTSYDDQLQRHHLFVEQRVVVISLSLAPEDASSISLGALDDFVWPAIPVGADDTYLKPWLCYDERGGPPPRQHEVAPEPFALLDWMQQTDDRVVPTTAALASLFDGIGGYKTLPIAGVAGWNVDLAARRDTKLATDVVASALIKMRQEQG